MTNRNKLIAECSDSPGHRACMNWPALASDGTTKTKDAPSSNSTLATGPARADDSTHGRAAVMVVWIEGGPPLRPIQEKACGGDACRWGHIGHDGVVGDLI